MTQMVRRETAIASFRSKLMKSKEQILMALPAHLSADVMIRTVMNALQADSKLRECSDISLLSSVMEASRIGLYPDGVTGEAHIVAYGRTANLIIGAKGYMTLAKRSGEVFSIHAYPVFEGDEFDYELGLVPDLRHKPRGNVEAAAMTHVYAVAVMREGRPIFEVMTRDQVDAIKRQARATKGPWVTHYVEMARKTAIRRLAKYLTLSPDLMRAASIDSMAEAGVEVPVAPEVVEIIEEEKPEPKSGLDALADAIEPAKGGVLAPSEDAEILKEAGFTPVEERPTPAILPAEDEVEPVDELMPKPKPRRITKKKIKGYEEQIRNNPKVPPFEVFQAIESRFGHPLADVTTAEEQDLLALLKEVL